MSRTRCRPGKPGKGALRWQQGRAGPGVAGGGVAKAKKGGARALANATAAPHDADCCIRVGSTRLPVHSHVLSLHSGVLADALQRQSGEGQSAGCSTSSGDAEACSSSGRAGDWADTRLEAAFQGYSLTEVQAFLHLVYHPRPNKAHSRQAGGSGSAGGSRGGWAGTEAPGQPQFLFHRLKQRQLERVVQLAAQLGADAVPARLEARLLDAGE